MSLTTQVVLGGDGGWAGADYTCPWLCSDLQEVIHQVAIPSLPLLSQTETFPALCGGGHGGLELGLAVGIEVAYWTRKAQPCAESISLLLMARHLMPPSLGPCGDPRDKDS